MRNYQIGSALLYALAAPGASAFQTFGTTKPGAALSTRKVSGAPLNVGTSIDNLFSMNKKEVDEGKFTVKKGDVVLEPAYSLGYGSVLIGFLLTLLFSDPMCTTEIGGICAPSAWGSFIGSQFALFGGICAVQAYRLRFIVTKDGHFTIKNVSSDPGSGTFKKSGKAELEDWGENYVVGGKNRWALKRFVNYKFFPNEFFPVLVYFKEVQTSKDKWDMGIGVLDKKENGQMHWFPAICNCIALKNEWEKRGVKKME